MPAYARHGVRYAWLVDPELKTIEVYKLTQEKWMVLKTVGGEDRVQLEPFEALDLELSELWI